MSVEPEPSNLSPAAAPPVAALLRLEGMAVSLLTAVLYTRTGASWWIFAALWLVPDLSMLGYFANSRVGAICYNAVHTYLLPLALAGFATLLHRDPLLPFALIWCNHIGVDRTLGYGLKYPAGFRFTHLSRLEKR